MRVLSYWGLVNCMNLHPIFDVHSGTRTQYRLLKTLLRYSLI
ncbi:unnamed protein product [Schistosoma margrebowiei]|uniref:Uncharacterized protein n=1 Tax=Schistosoma margrebowiei TaxID=48269 RepID=A0A183MGA7_9TREM|nr:unnamed protein product [Schistosoma margrebowiei]